MEEATIPIHEVARKYRDLLESTLMPLQLAEEFEKCDKLYRRALKKRGWSKRRWQLRSVVDEVIIAILSGSTGKPAEQILRRLSNETLVFYFDRLLCVRWILGELSQDRDAWIPDPESWTDFWIGLLVNSAVPPDPESM